MLGAKRSLFAKISNSSCWRSRLVLLVEDFGSGLAGIGNELGCQVLGLELIGIAAAAVGEAGVGVEFCELRASWRAG